MVESLFNFLEQLSPHATHIDSSNRITNVPTKKLRFSLYSTISLLEYCAASWTELESGARRSISKIRVS